MRIFFPSRVYRGGECIEVASVSRWRVCRGGECIASHHILPKILVHTCAMRECWLNKPMSHISVASKCLCPTTNLRNGHVKR